MTLNEEKEELKKRLMSALMPFVGHEADDLVKMRMAKVMQREIMIFEAELDFGLTHEYAVKLIDNAIKRPGK